MSDGFWGVLFVLALFALPFGWSYVSERSKAAAAVGDAAEVAVDGGRWIIMKGAGIVLGAAGVYLLSKGPEGFQDLAVMIFAIVYGGYLLFPGRPDEKSLWFW